MRGRWADQLKGEDSRYSPAGLQASWDVWNTRDCLLDIKKRGGNTGCKLWSDQWVSTVGWVGRGRLGRQTYQKTQETAEVNWAHN